MRGLRVERSGDEMTHDIVIMKLIFVGGQLGGVPLPPVSASPEPPDCGPGLMPLAQRKRIQRARSENVKRAGYKYFRDRSPHDETPLQ